jgi:hypothetical protein
LEQSLNCRLIQAKFPPGTVHASNAMSDVYASKTRLSSVARISSICGRLACNHC